MTSEGIAQKVLKQLKEDFRSARKGEMLLINPLRHIQQVEERIERQEEAKRRKT